MLASVPLLLFALVIVATLLRERAVRKRSGVGAWAFFEARGVQRAAGLAFALSLAVLVVAATFLAPGRIAALPVPLAVSSAVMALGALVVAAAQVQMGAAWRVGVREGDARDGQRGFPPDGRLQAAGSGGRARLDAAAAERMPASDGAGLGG